MEKPIHPTGTIAVSRALFLTSNLQPLASSSRRSHGPALLEAFPAKHRPPLRWPERNGGFLSALRAVRLCFRPHRRGVPPGSAFRALGLARFTTLRFVLKALVGEKHLLAGREHKLRTTFCTLQDLIVIFHEPLSPGPVPGRRLGGFCTWGPGCLRRPVSGNTGRGSLGPAATKLQLDPKRAALRGPISRKCGAKPGGKRKGDPGATGAAPELNPLPAAAFCAVASAKALP